MDSQDPSELIDRALAEDIGSGDVTAEATVPAELEAIATIRQKAPGVISGLDVAERCFRALDPACAVTRLCAEGEWRESGPVLQVAGFARALLAAERTALNFLGRLSGIATLTARSVRAVAGTGATILDTRKTTPGLRSLEKAAVVAGGGRNHRFGLYDQVLIKENHAALAGGVGVAVRLAAAHAPGLAIVAECETLEQVEEALATGVPGLRLLLDNMDTAALRAAVGRVAGRAPLEASGGFTLDGLRAVAETGVNFISIGALTHSAPALDLSMLLEPTP